MKSFFKLLAKLWFILAVVTIGAILFLTIDQAKDIFYGLSFDNNTGLYFLTLILVTLLWSFSIWYGARLLIRVVIYQQGGFDIKGQFSKNGNLQNKPQGFLAFAIKYVPRSLGLIPFVIILFSIDYGNKGVGIWYGGITFITSVLFFLFTILRRKLLKIERNTYDPFFRLKELTFKEKASLFLISSIGLIIILLLIVFPRSFSIAFGVAIGPIAVIILGMAIWTWVASVLTWLDSRTELPINSVLFILIILFSFTNDNDTIQSIKSVTREQKTYFDRISRPSFDEYFNQWQASSARPWNKFTGKQDTLRTIFIIAGEGGGSRASFWTSGILSKLDSAADGFYERIFLMSTVSGSSVGSGFFNAIHTIEDNPDPSKLNSVAGGDYLSPINTAMISGEVVQSILPFGIDKVDRAKYLEDAWSRIFRKTTKSSILDSAFFKLWEQDNFSIPANVFNVTLVESGQKGYISPIKLGLSKTVIDLMDSLPYGIPLKTAMSLSARFPFFTSTGTIKDSKDWSKKLYNVTDGGYYENTGLETALDIYRKLRTKCYSTKRKYQIVLLYIRNSPPENYYIKQHYNFLDFISLPLLTLYRTWSTESDPMRRQLNAYFNTVKTDTTNLNDNDEFLIIQLNHDNERLFPLSRYISKTTQKMMISEMNNMFDSTDVKNYPQYKVIKKITDD